MFTKFEIIGFTFSVALMAIGLYLLHFQPGNTSVATTNDQTTGVVVVDESTSDQSAAVGSALLNATDDRGILSQLVIDDVVIGTGDAVEKGDTVTVNYIGRLQNGREFDNSYTRGEPFTFTVGQGRVIPGWEHGVVGMKTDGQRILVIPSHLAYGENGVGPIPNNATLVFAIELLEIN